MEAFMLVMDMICMVLLLFCVVRAGRKDGPRSLGLFAYKDVSQSDSSGKDSTAKEKKNA